MRLEAEPSIVRAGIGKDRPYWALLVYPEAGEAGGCLRVPRGRADPRPAPDDPERSSTEAERRARGQVRRYAANRLNRLGTLTYAGAGCHDGKALRRDLGAFFRTLRRGLGEEALPYLWVSELHKSGHGLHAHFAVGRYVRQTLIRDAWGRGHVHIKLLGDLPAGAGQLEESRLAARYLAKYAGKSMAEARPAGLHRYEVAQGFQPRKIEVRGFTIEHAVRQASQIMGGAPACDWRSPKEGWDAPPTAWFSWS